MSAMGRVLDAVDGNSCDVLIRIFSIQKTNKQTNKQNNEIPQIFEHDFQGNNYFYTNNYSFDSKIHLSAKMWKNNYF